MLQLQAVQGGLSAWNLRAIDRDGTEPKLFAPTDRLTATLWKGGSNAALLSPGVVWLDFRTGLFTLSLTAEQLATLDYAGAYHCQVLATRAGTSIVIADFMVQVLPGPGSASTAIEPYCTLYDMLEHAPWLTMVQDDLTDMESFYGQRLEAKQWLDWLIVRAWRGTSYASFGDPGRTANFWLGGWARRSPMPSQWLINQLAGGVVITPLTLVSGGSGYTYATVVFTGGGPTATQAQAAAIVSGGQVISLQLIQAGYGYTSTPLLTITGDGTGATGTCQISKNTLMLRPQIIRVCALKAASIVGMGQIGRQNNIAVFGAMWRDMASSEAGTIVAELDLNGDGFADLVVPLVSTNTLFT